MKKFSLKDLQHLSGTMIDKARVSQGSCLHEKEESEHIFLVIFAKNEETTIEETQLRELDKWTGSSTQTTKN